MISLSWEKKCSKLTETIFLGGGNVVPSQASPAVIERAGKRATSATPHLNDPSGPRPPESRATAQRLGNAHGEGSQVNDTKAISGTCDKRELLM